MLEVLFPIVTGRIVAGLSAALTARAEPYTSSVTVTPKLPAESLRTNRMVTVRNDGGSQDVVQRHRYGFNVYAESSVAAEKLARMCMALLPTLADGAPIVRVSGLSGPYEIQDERTELVIVGTTTLSHYYFTGQVTSRGTDL